MTWVTILGVGCSSGGVTEPRDDPATGGQFGFGGTFSAGGSLSSGGWSAGGSAAGVAQVGSGGAPLSGGQAGAGQTGSGGGTGAGGIISGAGGALGSAGFLATGGSNAGGSNASDPGPAAYAPCPTDGTACKILPLGDSITWGYGDEGDGGYRGPLFALAVADGKKITFTGSLSDGPSSVSGQPFPRRNEGHSGFGISTVTQYSGGVAGIATVVPAPAFADASGGLPHVVLLMIGTNDTGQSTAADMTARLGALMDKITSDAPDALLVVAKITPLAWATAVINAYNSSIGGLVTERASAGKHVLMADMNTGFTSAMMGPDGIHPNVGGYQFIATEWYSVIGSVLP